MASWLDPLNRDACHHDNGTLHWLCEENWCPPEISLSVTKAGSMVLEITSSVPCQINSHARKTVPQREHILLRVDEHSSEEGVAWTETCQRLNVVTVKLPANTTHILQPFDQNTNRIFQQEIRRTRDVLLSMSHFSWENTAVKIKLSVAAHRALTLDVARFSFVEARLWPVDFRFLAYLDNGRLLHRPSSLRKLSENSTGKPQDVYTITIERRIASVRLIQNIHSLTNVQYSASRALAEV